MMTKKPKSKNQKRRWLEFKVGQKVIVVFHHTIQFGIVIKKEIPGGLTVKFRKGGGTLTSIFNVFFNDTVKNRKIAMSIQKMSEKYCKDLNALKKSMK